MAASGYMTEADFESIWGATIETARFGLINVRIGEVLNYLLTRDAATDITNTAILPMVEQLSEESLIELLQASKSNKFTDVWRFIQSNAARIIRRILQNNREVVKMIRQDLGFEKMEITTSRLPSSTSNW
ncbi:hypothetical protein LCGC14_0567020 [marine sediment metagenome]|uniref:Uncharacterized protein n=1 Tax=marine sediment metagenome TaxID=412755 RepID=A0A0F9RK94_9ZZZZ